MNTATENTHAARPQAPAYIAKALRLLFQPGQVAELRAPHTRKGTVSGYFDDLDKLAAAAAELSDAVPGVYVTLNPVKRELLARAVNRVEVYAKNTTGDADIVTRCWLPIDFDANRPSGISSTEAEHQAAIDRAGEARVWLGTLGFPEGILADSANGAHLLQRVDLPNNSESTDLIKRCLEALASRFSDAAVGVDLTCFNAARIWKVYGTRACKGDSTPDRPHRLAKIINVGDVQVVPLEILQKLASLAPEQPHRQSSNGHQPWNLDDYLSRHNIAIKRESAWNGGRRLILETCPWNPEHNRGEAFIVQFASGALSAGCHHNSCSGRGWSDLRLQYEPSYGGEQITQKPNNHGDDSVICYPGNGEDNSSGEPSKVSLPDCAWQGIFGIWRDIVVPCTEAPKEYLWASCLVTIGMVLGRNVSFRNPRALFPNFYAILIGNTGDDRKSTSLSFAEDALYQVGIRDQVDVLQGVQSSETIFESLARTDHAKTLIYCDEFRSLLSVAKRKGTSDILPRLQSLYYCPRRDSLNRREKSTLITNPFLSLLTATPGEYVKDLLGDLEVSGGFLNRFLVITGRVEGWKHRAPSASDSDWLPFVKALRDIQSRYSVPVELEWTDEADEIWRDFYCAWKESRRSWSERDQKLAARIDEHILKLAMVYAAIEKRGSLTRTALVSAISIGKYLQHSVLHVFNDVGTDSFSRAEKAVLDIVKVKHRVYRRHLQQQVYKKGINGELLGRVVSSLVKNGHVVEGKDRMVSGHERPWIEYVLQGPLTENR